MYSRFESLAVELRSGGALWVHMTDGSKLDARIAHWIEKLTQSAAPTAVALTKRALNSALRQHAAAHMDMSLGMETLSFLTEDHREGASALVEKRAPKFTGA
jgi:enoyl-CoA hydratase